MPSTLNSAHQPDEDFINKSLLASLDAQADAEPVLTSDDSEPSSSPNVVYPHRPDSPSPLYHFNNDYRKASFTSYPNLTRSRFTNQPYPTELYQPQYPYQKPFIDQYKPQPHPYPLPHYNQVQLSSQTPYGPHLPANAVPANPAASAPPPPAPSTVPNAPSSSAVNGEEISTIFVVGFPEDMQEREFQNMFTFSPGFEAATLKIPNKDYSAYSGLAPGTSSVSTSLTNGVRAGYQPYGGSNDPYNLLTTNQGGVVVDGGRDGLVSSWPSANTSAAQENDLASNAHYLSLNITGGPPSLPPSLVGINPAAPPRKQIIGFAKFRSREEALVARDVLQGRRVDIEKGAVLKAEMAKKNLHTKRGVGPVNGVGLTTVGAFQSVTQPQQQHTMGALGGMDEPKESNVPTATANLGSRMGWRDLGHQVTDSTSSSLANGHVNGSAPHREDEDRKREGSIAMYNLLGDMSVNGVRGARERAEEEERDRRRRAGDEAKERELNLMRLRANNSVAFDAFHGVAVGAVGMSRQSSSGFGSNNSMESPRVPQVEAAQQHHQDQEVVGPWDRINQPVGRARSDSQRSNSPPFAMNPSQHQPYYEGFQLYQSQQYQQQQHRPQSESSQTSGLDNFGGGGATSDSEGAIGTIGSGVHNSSSNLHLNLHMNGHLNDSDVVATPNSIRASASELVLNTGAGAGNGGITSGSGQQTPSIPGPQGFSGQSSGGNTSPTLPSPVASGASSSSVGSAGTSSTTGFGSAGERSTGSGSGPRGTVDQNPPINTLYVGNLPTSPPPSGFPHDHLEDTLRDVFSHRPGYRKLCFRQKSNGPMCFVEFEDVHYAAKAMTEMSGDTLRGAVKNGIRLSYSKNPLGVRTPTSAGGAGNSGGPTLQQQQQLVQTLNSHHHAHTQYHAYQQVQSQPLPVPQAQQQEHHLQDAFQPSRLANDFVPRGAPTILRRENPSNTQSTAPPPPPPPSNAANNGFLSSPPPRFFSTTPGTGMPFGPSITSTPLTSASSAFIPRGMNGGFMPAPHTGFSPFGMDAGAGMIPGDVHHLHHPQQHAHLHQLHHSTSADNSA